MNKLYSVHDHWTDIAKKNDVDIESIDGVITEIKVNGEDYGGGETWNTVFEGNVTTEVDTELNIATGRIAKSIDADEIKVTFGGVTYTCNRQSDNSYGATYKMVDDKPVFDWSEYPFSITPSGMIATENAGTYSLKIEEPQSGGGESDFSTAQVTLINNTADQHGISLAVPCVLNKKECNIGAPFPDPETDYNIEVVIYKSTPTYASTDVSGHTATCTGSISIISQASGIYTFEITGDGSITIS